VIRRCALLACGTVLLSAAASVSSQTPVQPQDVAEQEMLQTICTAGISAAFRGDMTRAESMFKRVLSERRTDARALTNLGNLRLLNGDIKPSLFYYESAALMDTTDAGIVLNQATALYLLGDTASADTTYAYGIELAGGLQNAANLLGLDIEIREPDSKASDTPRVRRADLIRRLGSALKLIPPKKRPKLVIAGARGTGEEATASILYWKH